ncbi:MAG: hypothetical protein WC675_00750 [Patescibacteria group bacterium]|jgi:hypothetical protein
MPKDNQSTVDQLKFFLTLQLEAYQRNDQPLYQQLEEKILDLEKKL